VYRTELHKRALQWERTMAYFAPGKACGGSGNSLGIFAIICLEGWKESVYWFCDWQRRRESWAVFYAFG
jgi:hypothetical protein